MTDIILAIDQGTTGSQAAFFNAATFEVLGQAKVEFAQIYPAPGLVEHRPSDIWASVLQALDAAWAQVSAKHPHLLLKHVSALGITNQRETCLAWNRKTGEVAGNAIVWQDRRTASLCENLRGNETQRREVHLKTGLVLDPYFSGTKISWMMDNLPQVAAWAASGELALGTIDCYLIYKLTGHSVHATEHTNASRTMLYSLAKGSFDPELASLFKAPMSALPEILPSCGHFGHTRGVPGLPDGIPITGVLGDQQAALFGQNCTNPGEAKITFGTGAFLLMHTGSQPVFSMDGLLTTVAMSTSTGRTFALEGAAFIAGAAIQFVRDNLGWISHASECENLALSEPRDPYVVFIPALAGLSAPYWNPHAKGALLGLSRGTSKAQIVRAIIESIALQNAALLRLMEKTAQHPLAQVAVDGGAALNSTLMQFQSDILRTRLVRPRNIETTALGAAKAALLGLNPGSQAPLTPADKSFEPCLPASESEALLKYWTKALEAIHHFSRP